jgi:RHS repeat-associated protein
MSKRDRLKLCHTFAKLFCLLGTQIAVAAYGQSLGGNPQAPVQPGPVVPVESSSSAFSGSLASADATTGEPQAHIPFRLEVARGKAQPTLGLDYSSLGGQREAGVGWGLSLPSIQRKNASGPPNYANDPTGTSGLTAATDRFEFSGASLVPICLIAANGSCPAAPSGEVMPPGATAGWSYFRREVDRTFDRFFWSPDHFTWIVEKHSGEVLEFGIPQDAGVVVCSACDMDKTQVQQTPGVYIAVEGVFRWNLVRQHDAMGTANEIQYIWSQVNGSQRTYLTDIFDTPGSPKGGAASVLSLAQNPFAHHTHLTWVPDQPLPVEMWSRMFRASPDQLLTRVDITSDSFVGGVPRALVRSYALSYSGRGKLGLAWWRNALTKVQMTGACPGIAEYYPTGLLPQWSPGECPTLPPTELTYTGINGPPAQWASMGAPTTGAGAPRELSVFADVDGDGALDLLHGPDFFSQEPPVPLTEYWRNIEGAYTISGTMQLMNPGATPGGASLNGQLFVSVNTAAQQNVQTVIGNFGLTSQPGIDVLALDWSHKTYLVFSSYPSAAGSSSSGPEAQLVPATSAWLPAPSTMTRQLSNGPIVYQAFIDIDGDGFPDWAGVDTTGAYPVIVSGLSVLTPAGVLIPASNAVPDQPFSFEILGQVIGTYLGFGQVTGALSQVIEGSIWFDDVNGDGTADVVSGGCILQACSIAVTPGRGDGTYGRGTANWVIPAKWSAEISAGTALAFMHDVNGDGLADLIISDLSGVTVFFSGGVKPDGTTLLFGDPQTGQPIQFAPPPQATLWATSPSPPILTFADVNASGVDDIVVTITNGTNGSGSDGFDPTFQNSTVYYIDMLGGAPQPLLKTISNGLGATTTLSYATTASLSALARAVGKPWNTETPQNMHVVTNVTTSLEGNSYAGGPYSTSYQYAQPVYDKRFRQFRGFDFVQTTHEDATNPANIDVTETTYLSVVTPTTTTPDVPWNVLVGLPSLSTTYSGLPDFVTSAPSIPAPGPALSTTHSSYRVDALATGIDGRVVRRVYAESTSIWHYAPSASTSGASGQSVTLDDVKDFEFPGATVSLFKQSTFKILGGSTTPPRTVVSATMDAYGNVTQVNDGGVPGSDTPVLQDNEWTNVNNDWNWQLAKTSIAYSGGPARTLSFTYDQFGNRKTTSAVLTGTGQLFRAVQASPVNAAADGTYIVSSVTYDDFGNIVTTDGANGFNHTELTYDSAYHQLIIAKSVYPSGASLTSKWSYDRGREVVTQAVNVDGATTTNTYDAFGRPIGVALQDPNIPAQSDASPDMTFSYMDIAGGPFQVVTTTQTVSYLPYVTREVVALTDALGRPVVEMATGGAADPEGTWICTGLTQRDAKGHVSLAYAPYSTTAAPGLVPPVVPGMPARKFDYDPFSRIADAYDLDGTIVAHYRYNALSRDTFDFNAMAALANGGAPMYSTVRFDGHGRIIESDERTGNGGGATGNSADTIATQVTYQATGEPLTITRSSAASGTNTYARTMQYDSLGRLVSNVEPNTSSSEIVNKLTGPVRIGWRYAYDLNGQLVGTSDARGCGVNYTYDNIGREVSEDYLPCEPSTQAPYTSPGASGAGTEVYNVYDAPEVGEEAVNVGGSPQSLVGRLSASYSRGEHTNYAYDARGRVTQISRQAPAPRAEAATGPLANRYAPWWYRTRLSYDDADRPVAQSVGVDVPELKGTGIGNLGDDVVTTAYDARNIPVQVGGSYGPIVANEQRDPDGRLRMRSYADVAGTAGTYTYDGRRNLENATMRRAPAPQWAGAVPGYPPPLSNCATSNCTTPTVLQDTTYSYDRINNPLAITDQRLVSEWPTNQGPVATTRISYDDRYRLTEVAYAYPGGGSEPQAENFESTDPPPISFEMPATRSQSQGYGYDWQGNIVASGDSTNALLQRSSGSAVYGSGGVTPNRVASGSNSTGSYTATYDAAGNLTVLKATLPASLSRSIRLTLTYDWDEAGHLRTAERSEELWADEQLTCSTEFRCVVAPPYEVTSATIRGAYFYDAGGTRTWHSSSNTGSGAFTLDVFPWLSVQQTAWTGTDYVRSSTTETPYLVSNGASYGRLLYDPTLPSAGGNPLHVYLELTDTLGSTSSTIDRDSSELVEQITYLANGQTETDYRPARWNGFRESYRYTGKRDDYDVGLVYYGARYYVPGLNRWASADPLTIHGFGGDINPYSFVRGSSYKFVDPVGLDDPPPGIDPSFKVTQTPTATIFSGLDIQFFPEGHDPAATPLAEPAAPRAGGSLAPDPSTKPPKETRTLTLNPYRQGVQVSPGIKVFGNVQEYKTAIAYLQKDPGMAQIISDLNARKTILNIWFNDIGKNEFDPGNEGIFWDPHSATLLTNGGTRSPALGLGHEMVHARDSFTHLWRGISELIWWPRYDNYDEMRVISGPETNAARTLGEGVRTDHSEILHYTVPTPISR